MTSVIAGSPVELTAHPLQRAGAFALAAIAGKRLPAELAETDLQRAVQLMYEDLQPTVVVESSKDPGGFWLGASHLLWPNSPMNPTTRKSLSPLDREQRLRKWRTLAGPGQSIGVPCALCGYPACGFYGKPDIPLGASENHRNTTARGHPGVALCRGCLASFHALPYGCAIARGRAAVLHSWDDRFMVRTVREQVTRMRRNAPLAARGFADSRPYARQVAALRRVRCYEERFTAGVDLMVFSNSNREQILDVHTMDHPLADWVRSARYRQELTDGWRYLIRSHQGPKMPGLSLLARNLFQVPGRVITVAASYLRDQAGNTHIPPGESPGLGIVTSNFAAKALEMNESDIEQIRGLAETVAAAINEDGSEFMKFIQASRKPNDLKYWLRRQAIARVRYSKVPAAFVTERQWLLLFGPCYDGYLFRDLLQIGVLEKLHELDPKWRRDDPDKRRDMDDVPGEMPEEEQNG